MTIGVKTAVRLALSSCPNAIRRQITSAILRSGLNTGIGQSAPVRTAAAVTDYAMIRLGTCLPERQFGGQWSKGTCCETVKPFGPLSHSRPI